MPRIILTTLNEDPWTPSKEEPYVLPPEETLQELLSQLESGDFDYWTFLLARKHLRFGHVMRAIQDCSLPFELGARVSRSGRHLKFNNPALRLLSIPATESTKIVVEDRQNWLSKAHFDVRMGSSGLYDLMRWLVQKVRAYEGRAARRQKKYSRRAGSKFESVSAVRERLAVRVLIKNAERVEEELLQKSTEFD